MPNRNRPLRVVRWLPHAAAVFFLTWTGWTAVEAPDPLQGISRDDLNLFGPVWTVTADEARFWEGHDGLVEGPAALAERMTFDRDGRLRERVVFDALRRPEVTERYSFSGQVIALLEEYTGTLATLRRTEYTHDASGRETTVRVLDEKGSLQEKRIYFRDETGQVTRVEEYSGAGILLFVLVCTQTDRETRVDRYGAAGELHSWSIKERDEDGNLVKLSLYAAGHENTPFVSIYAYDLRGNMTEARTSGQISLGPLTITPPETHAVYAYTYDEHGNWVERFTSVWAAQSSPPRWQTQSVTYRTITYHK